MREPILKTLGAIAREMRESKGVLAVEIGARIRHTEGVVSRFERGETVPRELDLMVQAYADELDVDSAEIWQATLNRWREQQASPRDAGKRAAVQAAQKAAQRRQSRQEEVPAAAPAQRRKRAAG